MRARMTGAFSAAVLAVLLTGCGAAAAKPDDGATAASRATEPAGTAATASQAPPLPAAQPAAEPTRPYTCPSSEILTPDPAAAFQSIHPGCFDYAVALAAADFPEPLPAGIDGPKATLDFTDPEVIKKHRDITIQYGDQDNVVSGHWLCAWMDVYLKALDSGDGTASRESMEYLEKFTGLPQAQNMVNSEVFQTSLIETAKAGDPGNLREYFSGPSCREFR